MDRTRRTSKEVAEAILAKTLCKSPERNGQTKPIGHSIDAAAMLVPVVISMRGIIKLDAQPKCKAKMATRAMLIKAKRRFIRR